MRKLIVAEFLSLDGIIQAPGGPEEDLDGEFRFGGWVAPYSDELTGQDVEDIHARPFELLLGRRTYDIWAAYWPYVPPNTPSSAMADVFNSVAKHVVTHRAASLEWRNSRALEGDPAETVLALKQQDGADLLTWGSAHLVQQLLTAGLVDELRLQIFPIVLGNGKRLFHENAQPAGFRLARFVGNAEGVLITHYVRAGEVRTGSFNDLE